MAQFCTKCGAPIGEGMSFCTSCGATVGAPSAPPAQAPAAPAAPAAAAPAPAAAPAAKAGSTVVKIILILLAVFLLVSLLGMGACVYYAYRVKQRVSQFEKQARVTFPTATATREVRTQPVTPAAPTPPPGPVVDTGVAVYPGATPWGGGSQMTLGTFSVKSQEYLTDDSVDKVVAFYKDKLGTNVMVTQSGGGAVVQLLGADGQTTVAIKPDASTGKTKISINRMGK